MDKLFKHIQIPKHNSNLHYVNTLQTCIFDFKILTKCL